MRSGGRSSPECGAACAVKFWGGIWVLAAIASAAKGRFRADVPRFIAGAAIAGLLLLAPSWLPAPDELVTQTLGFQLSRPPDGTIDKVARLWEMLDSGHRAATVLSVLGLAVAIRRIRERPMRLFVVAILLTVAGFLASSSYWSHYNSHLALSQCALAGVTAAALVQWRRALAVAVVLLMIVLDARSLVRMFRPNASAQMLSVARTVPMIVPRSASLFAFDPTESLVAGRLPPHAGSAPVVVDSYGAMLLDATRAGGPFPDTATAFQKNPGPSLVRQRLASSDFVLLGWRGNWQMNDGDRRWFAMRFICVNPEAGDLCVWQRRTRPLAHAPSIDGQLLRFGEGWHDAEAAWRWMAGRSVMTLPPRGGAARLTLQFEVPLQQLAAPPTITIALDGRVLDRFPATTRDVRRTYDVESGDVPHTLLITTDRTFNPARSGQSADTRDLGLSLTGITWRSAMRYGGAAVSTSSPP